MKWLVILLLTLSLYLTLAPQLFGDGSDPMPLCRERRCLPK